MKTLAESIRSSLELLGEASGNLEYALSDLHKESNGEPTQELADEIAADYPGVDGAKLMAAYPEWVANQKEPTAPVMDPAKAREKAKWDHKQLMNRNDAEWAAKRQAHSDEQAALRDRHGPELERTRAAIEEVQAPAGWNLEVKDPEYVGPLGVSDMEFTNDAGNIRIIMHVTLNNKESKTAPENPYTIHGDTTYESHGKWYTFTAYDKHGSSFYMDDLAEMPETLMKESARAQKSIDAKKA